MLPCNVYILAHWDMLFASSAQLVSLHSPLPFTYVIQISNVFVWGWLWITDACLFAYCRRNDAWRSLSAIRLFRKNNGRSR